VKGGLAEISKSPIMIVNLEKLGGQKGMGGSKIKIGRVGGSPGRCGGKNVRRRTWKEPPLAEIWRGGRDPWTKVGETGTSNH